MTTASRASNFSAQIWLASAILLIHVALLAYGAWIHSPGMDEPDHLVAGLSHWRLGTFALYRVNPPLVRCVAALPVLAVGVKTPWDEYDDRPAARSRLAMRDDFAKANADRIYRLHTYARWACIVFSLIGACVCYRWASELYGPRSGLAALALWCFSPNILAHAQMITPDTGAAAMGVLAAYAFWKWLQDPRCGRSLAAGLALGLAELSKSSLIVLYGCWPLA